jgi:hypothetical protein
MPVTLCDECKHTGLVEMNPPLDTMTKLYPNLYNPHLTYDDFMVIHSLILDFKLKGYDSFSDKVQKVKEKVERKLNYFALKENSRKNTAGVSPSDTKMPSEGVKP